MKRLTMIVALSVMMVLPALAERVTPETARKVATTFLNNNGAKNIQLTDLSKDAGFPNLYIFTTESSFVVMSADDCVKPILGYSLTGAFVTEDTPENISSWLQGYNDGIQYAIENRVKSTIKTKREWDELANGKPGVSQAVPVVDALVKTKWNQGSPYNNQCPKIGNTRTVTGCVATAMAQVMKFWGHPITGTDSHDYSWNNQTLSADFETTTYDWDNMTNTYNSSSNATQKAAVATLMYHCGVSIEMNYGTSASSASTYDVIYALQTYFSYAACMHYEQKDSYSDSEWITMLKNELNEGRPLQYRGSDAGGNGGHSFVCDGYDNEDLFHFNWGWGGYCDGFYAIDDMEPGTGGIGAGNGVYTVGQSAIFGIEPISSIVAPTLSATAVNASINLSWTDVAEASYYEVYKDNTKIATNISELTYTDNDVISGVFYKYYVRAVSATGTKSNPSNSVTKSAFYRDYKPTNLSATLSNNNAILIWDSPESNSTDLHYGTTPNGYRYGMGENTDTYWAETFPAARLSDYAGLLIQKVSAYLYLPGEYTLYLYEQDPSIDANKIYEQTFTNSSAGWKDFNITSSLVLDHTKDLWVIMYYPYTTGSSESYWYPAPVGDYAEIPYNGPTNPECYYPRWIGSSLESWYYVENNISWLFRAFLTDGTFTYNLYDNGTNIASDLSETNYTVASPANNTTHQYTVKTNYYGGESNASNMAGLTIGTASLSTLTLNATDKMTVTEGSQLTVEGSLIDDNADNLILEDGAQLVNGSTGVLATVKKDIGAYTGDGGWNLIASPVTEDIEPNANNGLLTNNYDLYTFDQSEALEWRNYEAQTFAICNTTGYLYANNGTPTVTFKGTLAADIDATPLTYDANASFKGFNLIGNPYPCNTYVNRSFYVLNEDGSDFTLGDNPIPPCAAILVQAQGNEESVTFSKTELNKEPDITIALSESGMKSHAVLDEARISFNEIDRLAKYNLTGQHSRLYIPQDGQNLAVACIQGQTSMPVNFKACRNGTYTLSIASDDLDLDYLHLIDYLTGADVDLLASNGGDAMNRVSTYTFEAKTTDYASRFRLVFAPQNAEDDNDETFAYVNNGEIVITDVETFQETSLQVVDMTGRIVLLGDAMNRVSTEGLTAGVYVLRLITTDGVKTQKIVIE